MEAASPLLLFPPLSAAPGYGAAPSGFKGRNAIAARRASGPPLTPEPLRPLTGAAARARAGAGAPARPNNAALNGSYQDQIPTNKSLRFQGIAGDR
jgi:hypothetical protein